MPLKSKWKYFSNMVFFVNIFQCDFLFFFVYVFFVLFCLFVCLFVGVFVCLFVCFCCCFCSFVFCFLFFCFCFCFCFVSFRFVLFFSVKKKTVWLSHRWTDFKTRRFLNQRLGNRFVVRCSCSPKIKYSSSTWYYVNPDHNSYTILSLSLPFP